jgi:uncharacterized protein YbaR (Trm112 family)
MKLVTRVEERVAPIGRTPRVLVREDGGCAYPVVDGVPVLLAPEMLMPPDQTQSFDLSSPQYAEAYEEMDYYCSVGGAAVKVVEDGLETADERRTTFRELASALGAPESARASFPHPREIWIDARFDAAAQWERGTCTYRPSRASVFSSSVGTAGRPSSSSQPARRRRSW